MMENKIQNGHKSVYEPVKVRVQQITPQGLLCHSGHIVTGGTVTGALSHDTSYTF